MFTAVLFITGKNWKQAKRLTGVEIHTSIKDNDIERTNLMTLEHTNFIVKTYYKIACTE